MIWGTRVKVRVGRSSFLLKINQKLNVVLQSLFKTGVFNRLQFTTSNIVFESNFSNLVWHNGCVLLHDKYSAALSKEVVVCVLLRLCLIKRILQSFFTDSRLRSIDTNFFPIKQQQKWLTVSLLNKIFSILYIKVCYVMDTVNQNSWMNLT